MADGTYTETCNWIGASGATYKYWVYPLGQTFDPVPGNYIFAKRDIGGYWVPVYVGQTTNLGERFDYHHAAECIRRNGATHIHAKANTSKASRMSEETDIRANYRTSCNRQ